MWHSQALPVSYYQVDDSLENRNLGQFIVLMKCNVTHYNTGIKMEKGTVKWFDFRKNYGFIERKNESDVFVHASDIENNQLLDEGDEVSFEVEDAPRGLRAVNVVREEA